MNFFHHKNYHKKLGEKILAILLAVTIAVPSVFAFMPTPPAQATISSCISAYTSAAIAALTMQTTAAITSVPVGANGQISSQIIGAGNGLQNFFKDCIEHGLALMIGKMLLSQMTNQIVGYINSGFHGSPAFVGDPKAMFQNIGDQVLAGALAGVSNGIGVNICSPFRAQLLAGLAANFGINVDISTGNSGGDFTPSEPSGSVCEIASAISNPNNFQNWGDFLGASLNDQNNPYGAFLASVNNIENQIVDQVNNVSSQLNWGSGFLSQQDCTHTQPVPHSDQPVTIKYTKPGGNGISVSASVGSGTAAPSGKAGSTVIGQDPGGSDVYSDPENDTCTITTPGKTIADTLQNQLNIPADQLGVADDLDKIFNALFNELLKTGLGALGLGAGGLASAGGSGGGGASAGVWAQIAASASVDAQQGTADAQAEESAVSTQIQNTGSTQPNQNGSATGGATNVALNKTVIALPGSRSGFDPTHLTDGGTDMGNASNNGGFYGAITSDGTAAIPASLTIDLGQQTDNLFKIVAYPHNPGCYSCWGTAATFKIIITDQNRTTVWDSASAGNALMKTIDNNVFTLTLPQAVSGRYVTVQAVKAGSLQLAEVGVYKDNGPTITLTGQAFTIGTIGQALSSYDAGASAVDVAGQAITPTVSYSGANGSATASTPLVSGQSYTITYTATDSYGASSTASRTVESISGASTNTATAP